MNKLSLIIGGLSAAFLLWLVLSWFDVITDNMSEHPQHSEYNAFVVMVDIMEGANE